MRGALETQAQWHVCEPESGYRLMVKPIPGQVIADVLPQATPDETLAVARLIAAAPELLEAAENALAVFGWIGEQSKSAMCISAGAAGTSGDPEGALQMLNSIASDAEINATMAAEKLIAAIARATGK